MCRMIAFASERPQEIAPFLSHLARLCARGNLVDRWERRPGGNHPDGWGIAFLREGKVRSIRSARPASGDPVLGGFRGTADRFVGHVRYASDTETVNVGNAHPFVLGGIALAHNGTFRGRIGEEAKGRRASDTLVFLERLASAWEDRTLDGLAGALSRLLGDEGAVGAYSAANLVILAGESLFALRNYRKEPDYYTLYLRSEQGLAVIASEPLDESGGWRLLADGEVVELCLPSPRSLLLDRGAATGT